MTKGQPSFHNQNVGLLNFTRLSRDVDNYFKFCEVTFSITQDVKTFLRLLLFFITLFANKCIRGLNLFVSLFKIVLGKCAFISVSSDFDSLALLMKKLWCEIRTQSLLIPRQKLSFLKNTAGVLSHISSPIYYLKAFFFGERL